ncbi:exopolyphosphatase [Lentzea sp. NBRC 105346]|uniref:Ppx/GppA phosphatase family protein n=1 Tax=Lentzea sp. NBRC 105346 TaxID=3032205 RepID=UPI00249F9CDD|nr:exopolyphosphatase [Lentzea sp. NBRC 105346]GLZ33822.1 exopolyphosphatase [Lentzea sp. NBRC 105346]
MAGVLDVGCFSAHLVVVDRDLRHPVLSHKVRLRLDRVIDRQGRISRTGIDQISEAVQAARKVARRAGIAGVVPFATSSVRDAPNAAKVIERVADRTGVWLKVLSGKEEARLAYVAARHWFGRGSLLVLDVGGGTVEVAHGDAANPSFTCSLPLGARTLTMTGLTVPEMRSFVADGLSGVDLPASGRAVGCSKVFGQMARLAGTRRVLRADDLTAWIPRLAKLSASKRARLPGISRHRAHQSLAGAVVAEGLMRATGQEAVEISPWSTKEGLLLSLLENRAVSAA